MSGTRIHGCVESGQGVGAGFTRTDWALGVFRDAYGIDPFPGTLNVRADAASLSAWQDAAAEGRLFPAPDPSWCDARCLAATLHHDGRSAPAVIVVPQVAGYPPYQIELVAARNLRDSLGLADGSSVAIVLG